MPYTSYSAINSFDEFSIIGGNYFIIEFNIYDEMGRSVNVSGGTLTWNVGYYGTSSAVFSVNGNIIGENTFDVIVPEAYTESLSGKFVHQAVYTDVQSHVFIPAQGVITIIPKIK